MPEAAPSPFGRISLNRRVASSLGLVGPCAAGGGPGFLASAHGDGRRRLSRWSHSIHCQQAWSLLLLCPGVPPRRLQRTGPEEKRWPPCPRGAQGVRFLGSLWGYGTEEEGGISLQREQRVAGSPGPRLLEFYECQEIRT